MPVSGSLSSSDFAFVNPATQTPLFIAEWVTCAYPISDIYASSPRYLYYALLVLVFMTQWHEWLANVFLGVIATYAGTAAMEAFVLIAHIRPDPVAETVTIPYVDGASVTGNRTLELIKNLVVNRTTVKISPAANEFDIDALLAITVTGYLMMLPMHCWSTAVRATRVRHLIILLWNMLMLAGTTCSLVLWPTLLDNELQYRFCYPMLLDTDSVTSDRIYRDVQYRGSWNETIWSTFSDFNIAANLNDNCFYPCFNTTQVLRRPSSMVADLNMKYSLRTATALFYAGQSADAGDFNYTVEQSRLANWMYTAIIVTTVIMALLCVFLLTPARKITRVPIHRPKELFGRARKELFRVMWQEFKHGMVEVKHIFTSPSTAWQGFLNMAHEQRTRGLWQYIRFWLDTFALLVLLFAMVITPCTIIVFVVFIEYYIHRDLGSSESAQQVGQWGTIVSVSLVLISALVLRLRYVLAGRAEVENEIAHTRAHLRKLEELLERRRGAREEHEMEEGLWTRRQSGAHQVIESSNEFRHEMDGRARHESKADIARSSDRHQV